jgi:hypothetical protein
LEQLKSEVFRDFPESGIHDHANFLILLSTADPSLPVRALAAFQGFFLRATSPICRFRVLDIHSNFQASPRSHFAGNRLIAPGTLNCSCASSQMILIRFDSRRGSSNDGAELICVQARKAETANAEATCRSGNRPRMQVQSTGEGVEGGCRSGPLSAGHVSHPLLAADSLLASRPNNPGIGDKV